jgi:hypothetical protein
MLFSLAVTLSLFSFSLPMYFSPYYIGIKVSPGGKGDRNNFYHSNPGVIFLLLFVGEPVVVLVP